MRIVGGSLKGRSLVAPDGRVARPTADRVREALFNILAHGDYPSLSGARVVDAFAGSGGLGFESLSRGAAAVTFLETHAHSLKALEQNKRALDKDGQCRILRADVLHPPQADRPCQLVFLDAPYDQGLSQPALAALAARGWVDADGLVVVEVAAREVFIPPAGFAILDERIYGAARLILCRPIAVLEGVEQSTNRDKASEI